VTIFAGVHGVIEVITDSLLKGISFGKVMVGVTRMARETSEPLGFMNIRFGTPLAPSLFSVGDRVTGPTTLIGGLSDDLKVKSLEISDLLFRIVHRCLIHFGSLCFSLVELERRPACSDGWAVLENPCPQSLCPFLPGVTFQMANQTIRLAHTTLVPGRSDIDVSRGVGGVVAIQQETLLGSLNSDSLCFLTEIEIASAIEFAKTSSRVASSTILDEGEYGLINVRWGFIHFPSQLARISRSESVLAKHSRREVPRMRGIEQIADDHIPLPVCSALLKVIPIRNAKIVMAVATGLLWTIGDLTLDVERYSVEPS
jgi:hypothetical protein